MVQMAKSGKNCEAIFTAFSFRRIDINIAFLSLGKYDAPRLLRKCHI